MSDDKREVSFVRLLMTGKTTIQSDRTQVKLSLGKRRASLLKSSLQKLISSGILQNSGGRLAARPEAKNWIKRKLLQQAHFSSDTVVASPSAGPVLMDLNESPLARLGRSQRGQASFLAPHHIAAGEKVRKLVGRAQIMQRTTMSYDPTRLPGSGSTSTSGPEIGDLSLDARTKLFNMLDGLPTDCAAVVLDVCGFLKGLQLVEQERRWPRRSAKLVLRIGLEQAATHFGLLEVATGRTTKKPHVWLTEGSVPTKLG